MQERSVHLLILLFYPLVRCVYLQARSVCPRVRSVPRMNPREIPVCDFFLHKGINYLPVRIHFYRDPNISPGCQIFALRESIFIALIDLWPRANWEMVTNNLTAVSDVALSEAAMYVCFMMYFFIEMYLILIYNFQSV